MINIKNIISYKSRYILHEFIMNKVQFKETINYEGVTYFINDRINITKFNGIRERGNTVSLYFGTSQFTISSVNLKKNKIIRNTIYLNDIIVEIEFNENGMYSMYFCNEEKMERIGFIYTSSVTKRQEKKLNE